MHAINVQKKEKRCMVHLRQGLRRETELIHLPRATHTRHDTMVRFRSAMLQRTGLTFVCGL